MVREYELQESVLVVHITDRHWFKKPNLIIRLDLRTKDFSVRNLQPSWNRAYIVDEVKKLLALIELPYWKSVVGVQSVHNHPDTYGPLF